MPEPERRMLTALFAGSDSIEMDKANHTYFGAARKALQENLQDAYLGKIFLRNLGWAWVGLHVSARRDPVRRHDDRPVGHLCRRGRAGAAGR